MAISQPQIGGVHHVDISVTNLEASTAWYGELLGMVELFSHRNDERGYAVRYLAEPTSGIVMGFEQHDANPGTPFDERRVGLDHLSWSVQGREHLDAWLERLDERGIPHSGISEHELWDVLVFRDPDNVQLEFIYLKPAAANLLGN
jgi:catechol 2,3-dioxygenase-like lactoylglutathione lyase family enzyme